MAEKVFLSFKPISQKDTKKAYCDIISYEKIYFTKFCKRKVMLC